MKRIMSRKRERALSLHNSWTQVDFSSYHAITINTILISIKVDKINGAILTERTHLQGGHTNKGRGER